MGVDPGLVDTGFGILEAGPGAVTVVDAGVVSTASNLPLEARLNAIHRAMLKIIDERRPTFLVVEDLYTEYKFPRTAILMGHARGATYRAARQLAGAVTALPASEGQRGGSGNAGGRRAQVQRALQTLL